MQRSQLLSIFGENVRTRRKERGLTQAQLASALSVTQPYVAQIESGKRSTALEMLAPLADALGTTPDALLTPKIFSAVPVDAA